MNFTIFVVSIEGHLTLYVEHVSIFCTDPDPENPKIPLPDPHRCRDLCLYDLHSARLSMLFERLASEDCELSRHPRIAKHHRSGV